MPVCNEFQVFCIYGIYPFLNKLSGDYIFEARQNTTYV